LDSLPPNNLFLKTELCATNLSSGITNPEDPRMETRMATEDPTRDAHGFADPADFFTPNARNPLISLDLKK
jgi:hypothetical protein